VFVVGVWFGVIGDVVLSECFESDLGSDVDVDLLYGALVNVLVGFDEYVDVVDLIVLGEVVFGLLFGDLVMVVVDFLYGLCYFESGWVDEVLWWW